VGPAAVDALARLADDAREVDAWLREAAEVALSAALRRDSATGAPDAEIQLEPEVLATYHRSVARYALRIAYERLRGSRADLTRDHLNATEALLRRTGELNLPGGVRAVREHGRLRFTREARPAGRAGVAAWGPISIGMQGTVRVPDLGLRVRAEVLPEAMPAEIPSDEAREAVFDCGLLRPPLEIRSWRHGDRFSPLGLRGTQKLSDLFVNRKVPRFERARIPLLTDSEGILWVVGHRRSDRARVTRQTTRALRVTVLPDHDVESNETAAVDDA
jgi:tRNA(Ile)-lysidine synthase